MIKTFRKKYNMTQVELAKLSGVSRQRISDFENQDCIKETPKLKQLTKFMILYNSQFEQVKQYEKTNKIADFFIKLFRRLFK